MKCPANKALLKFRYYPFGLKIATISSRKLSDAYEGNTKNNYLYNDKELFDDGDLNWYDYGFRNYDPQIGRFTQLDPLTFEYPFYTPYQFAGDEPIANVDMDGLEPWKVLEEVVVTSGKATPKVAQGLSLATKIGMGVKAINLINTSFLSHYAGNVSESTNPYRPGQLGTIRSGAYLPPKERKLELSYNACNHCGTGPLEDKMNLMTPESDPIAKIIRRETIEKFSNRPGDELLSFIGLRNLVVAGRMELGGFHKEAWSSLKKSPGEMSLMLFPYGEIAEEGFQAAKGVVQAEKVSGSYLLEFQSGKFYAGKGLEPRMMQS
ncbi:MAG TPA: RHS repeat-associated core domain-containing protein, partial [Chitinophagaceae bacterium]|nr:RHS repeat-associated core domain-containing protein [Chitinophagaceae bacterium]